MLLCLVVILLALVGAQAQVVRPFQWGFTDASQSVSPLLPQCQSLAIMILSLSSNASQLGTPPYYMMAFEPGGYTSSSFLGTDPKNLTWQPRYNIGTQLMLSIADATGAAGGVSNMYSVSAGQGSSCMHNTTNSLSIRANVTQNLQTCQPWGLRVTGGTSPYNLTILSPGSATLTNITLPNTYDVFTYINRANPNGQLLAAVCDSTGQWGSSTQFVNTVGSKEINCTGLSSEAGQSSQIPFYSNNNPGSKNAGMSNHTIMIIAVCAALGGMLLLGLGLFFGGRFWTRRKFKGQDMVPRLFNPPALLDERPDPFLWGRDSSGGAGGSSSAMSSVPQTWQTDRSYSKLPLSEPNLITLQYQSDSDATNMVSVGRYHNQQALASSSSTLPRPEMVLHPPPPESATTDVFDPASLFSFSQAPSLPSEINYPHTGNPERAFPTSPTATSSSSRGSRVSYNSPVAPSPLVNSNLGRQSHSKLAESRLYAAGTSPTTPRSGQLYSPPANGARPLSNRPDDSVQPDIIIQHRDGGTVQELPPPYLDRGSHT